MNVFHTYRRFGLLCRRMLSCSLVSFLAMVAMEAMLIAAYRITVYARSRHM